MALRNIGRDQSDPNYRYKMPPIVIKNEGRGNGVKTVLVNIVDVAKALKCDPRYPLKYIGVELGAHSEINKDRYLVTGTFNQKQMQDMVDGFISVFIICPRCKDPEIRWDVSSKGITIDCAACGHHGPLRTGHKLVSYIVKNPPAGSKAAKAAKSTGKAKGGRKGKAGKGGEETKEEGGEGDEKDDGAEGDDAEAETKEAGDKPKKAVGGGKSAKEDEADDDWSVDTSEEAQAQRMKAELAERKADKKPKAEEKKDQVSVFKTFLTDKERSVSEITAELRRLQISRTLDEPQKVRLLLTALFDPEQPAEAVKIIKKNAGALKAVASDSLSAKIFIYALEEVVTVTQPKLLPRMALILQALYDADVLEEDTILQWFDAPAAKDKETETLSKQVRDKAAKFVTWLKEADDEDDDDED